MQARSRSVQERSSGRMFSSSERCASFSWYTISILLFTAVLASSHPLFSISRRTRWRTVTAAGHLRYRVLPAPSGVISSSFFDNSLLSLNLLSSSASSSSCRLKLTESSKVRSRAPTGGANGGHCGFTRRKCRRRSSSDRKRPGTARYTSRWRRTSGSNIGDAATLQTGHARTPLLRRRRMQPLQTSDSRRWRVKKDHKKERDNASRSYSNTSNVNRLNFNPTGKRYRDDTSRIYLSTYDTIRCDTIRQ